MYSTWLNNHILSIPKQHSERWDRTNISFTATDISTISLHRQLTPLVSVAVKHATRLQIVSQCSALHQTEGFKSLVRTDLQHATSLHRVVPEGSARPHANSINCYLEAIWSTQCMGLVTEQPSTPSHSQLPTGHRCARFTIKTDSRNAPATDIRPSNRW